MMRADEINAGSHNVYRELQVPPCNMHVHVALVVMNKLLVLSAF